MFLFTRPDIGQYFHETCTSGYQYLFVPTFFAGSGANYNIACLFNNNVPAARLASEFEIRVSWRYRHGNSE